MTLNTEATNARPTDMIHARVGNVGVVLYLRTKGTCTFGTVGKGYRWYDGTRAHAQHTLVSFWRVNSYSWLQ